MAAGNVSRVIRSPGRIVLDPTTAFASTAYPYGGVEVGKTMMCAWKSEGTPFRVESEALGEATDILESGNRYSFACLIRGWDDDAIRMIWALGSKTVGTASGGYEQGATTQHSVFFAPGLQLPGESAIPRSVILVFVPDDTVHVPAVLIYNGIPDWDDDPEFMLQRGEELTIPFKVDCLRNSSGKTLRAGRIEDLIL
jgi:hypothetical protein